MGSVINIIIQLVSGGLGGLGAGKVMPQLSLGKVWDILAGIVGGFGGVQLLGGVGDWLDIRRAGYFEHPDQRTGRRRRRRRADVNRFRH